MPRYKPLDLYLELIVVSHQNKGKKFMGLGLRKHDEMQVDLLKTFSIKTGNELAFHRLCVCKPWQSLLK